MEQKRRRESYFMQGSCQSLNQQIMWKYLFHSKSESIDCLCHVHVTTNTLVGYREQLLWTRKSTWVWSYTWSCLYPCCSNTCMGAVREGRLEGDEDKDPNFIMSGQERVSLHMQ